MSTSQFNSMPNYTVPLEVGKVTSKDWYFFWSGLFRGLAPGNVEPVVVTASPFVYSATRRGSLIVKGGTVTLIEFSRDGGTTYYDVGVIAGMFPVNAADLVRITYAVAPTVTFVPS
jgi:hypothetical protein